VVKARYRLADARGMSARTEADRSEGVERLCHDCGSPIEADVEADKPFLVCRPCYEAPVENAGR
jgi:hypothetical protein